MARRGIIQPDRCFATWANLDYQFLRLIAQIKQQILAPVGFESEGSCNRSDELISCANGRRKDFDRRAVASHSRQLNGQRQRRCREIERGGTTLALDPVVVCRRPPARVKLKNLWRGNGRGHFFPICRIGADVHLQCRPVAVECRRGYHGRDRPRGRLQHPVAADRGVARDVDRSGHVGASEAGEDIDKCCACWTGRDIAAVEQNIGVSRERSRPRHDFPGAGLERRRIDSLVAEHQSTGKAVRDDLDRRQIAAAGERRRDLGDCVAVGIERDHLVRMPGSC